MVVAVVIVRRLVPEAAVAAWDGQARVERNKHARVTEGAASCDRCGEPP